MWDLPAPETEKFHLLSIIDEFIHLYVRYVNNSRPKKKKEMAKGVLYR